MTPEQLEKQIADTIKKVVCRKCGADIQSCLPHRSRCYALYEVEGKMIVKKLNRLGVLNGTVLTK